LNFKENIKGLKVTNVFKKYINNLNKFGFKNETNVYPEYTIPKYTYDMEDNNKIMLMFSGGKDSTALAMKYKELGYDVTLYFLQGVNLSYLDELEKAKIVAAKLDLPMVVDYVKVTGKSGFLENPTKNQLILSYAINKGIELGIYRYSYGGFTEDIIEQAAFDRNYSDSIELFQWYVEGVKEVFPKLEVITPFKSEVETLKLIGEHKDIWNLFQSCLTPYRYRNHLKETNENKYGIKLLDNRCGSCWKCCMEYIVWCDLGLVEYNKEFYKHCLDIFINKLPEERPYAKPTKDYKEAYMIYIENEELLNKSKFFKEVENG
jgi:7-cyano-7-deazaguanine synthase in queuosine biosynthesis